MHCPLLSTVKVCGAQVGWLTSLLLKRTNPTRQKRTLISSAQFTGSCPQNEKTASEKKPRARPSFAPRRTRCTHSSFLPPPPSLCSSRPPCQAHRILRRHVRIHPNLPVRPNPLRSTLKTHGGWVSELFGVLFGACWCRWLFCLSRLGPCLGYLTSSISAEEEE